VETPDESIPASRLMIAAHQAVMYADIFDCPLTRDEIFEFLPARASSRGEVDAAIDLLLADGDAVDSDGSFIYCAGRGDLVKLRGQHIDQAKRAWPRARSYGRIFWAIPFVRMVAVTGALTVNNVHARDDIDFLVVTEPGRLWLTRGMIVLVCRLARLFGDTLCPNYLVTTRAMNLKGRDVYTAHELAQMVPLHGRKAAQGFWAENMWYRELLPNSRNGIPAQIYDELPRPVRIAKVVFEALLRLPPMDRVEEWEQRRKIARLSRNAPTDATETHYTAEVCKGHDSAHRTRTMEQWAQRIEAMRAARAA
jgi:hypothetical protein